MTILMGADNGAYRGGVTRLRVLIRNSRMYKEWKDLVYQRDRYKCQDCGFFGDRRTLECHHVGKEFAEQIQDFLLAYPQYTLPKDEARLAQLSQCYPLFWKLSGGRTLCKNCHKTLHKTEKLNEKVY